MNKYKIIIIIETIILLIILLISLPINKHISLSMWFGQSSPDEKYTLVADIPDKYQYSETTIVYLTIYDENSNFDTRKFFVRNNYEILNENNYELEWYDDYVKLTIINYGGFKCIYRIYWEDLNFSSHSYDE